MMLRIMIQIWIYTLVSVSVVSLISLVGIFALGVKQERLQRILFYLISFSAGALLGDVFIHILPEIMEGEGALRNGSYVLAGIMLFMVLERILRWHQSHSSHKEEIHSVVYLTIIGDALQHHEQHDSGEYIAAVSQCPFPLHDFRKNMNEHVTKQCTGRKAYEVKEYALETFLFNS